MKIVITNDEERILVHTDLRDMDRGLIGQIIAELELIKLNLLDLYELKDEDKKEN